MTGNDITPRTPGQTRVAALALADRLSTRIEYVGDDEPTLPLLPSTSERELITRALDVMAPDLALVAESKDRARAALSQMFYGFDQVRRLPDNEQRELIGAHAALLRDVPIASLEHACDLVRTGKFKDRDPQWNPHWPPSGPALYMAAADHASRMWREVERLRRPLGITKQAAAPMTEDERARVGEQMAALARDLGAKFKSATPLTSAESRDRAQSEADRYERDVLALWRALGRDPVRSNNGVLLTPEVADYVARAGVDHVSPVKPRRKRTNR